MSRGLVCVQRLCVRVGHALLYRWFGHRVEVIVPETGEIVAVILSVDREAYLRNFSVTPRFHTMPDAAQREAIH